MYIQCVYRTGRDAVIMQEMVELHAFLGGGGRGDFIPTILQKSGQINCSPELVLVYNFIYLRNK